MSVLQTGGRYPSGSVTVSVDGSVAAPAAALINGAASISYTPHAGDHTITATYGGDSYFAAAIAARSPSVPSARPLRSYFQFHIPVHGQSPVFTATVGAGGAQSPAQWTSSPTARRSTLRPSRSVSGQAQLGSYAVSAGNHAITAQYNGDANNLASNNNAAPLLLTVNRASVQVSTPSSLGNPVYGAMTFSVTISVLAPGGGVPSGTISLNDGSSTVATATLAAGAATFSVTTLAVGSHTLTAVYPGDSNYAPATSTALPLNVCERDARIDADLQPRGAVGLRANHRPDGHPHRLSFGYRHGHLLRIGCQPQPEPRQSNRRTGTIHLHAPRDRRAQIVRRL